MTNITSSSVFVVSGGAKGITARCVEKLASRYQCKFILLGRSPLADSDPAWAQGASDDNALKMAAINELKAQGEKPTPIAAQRLIKGVLSRREIMETLAEIERVGGQACYMSVDITDADSVKSAIDDAQAQLGTVNGIIHGAGVLADKLIENKTQKDFEMVYSTKVDGLNNLLSAVSDDQLRYLVLFSSVAGFYGNIGQTDYAIANEILNKAAHIYKQTNTDCRVISINWGPWDAGMVTPQLKAYFESNGIKVIPIEVGTDLLIEELEATYGDTIQVVVGSGIAKPPASEPNPELKKYTIHRKLRLEKNPFLQDHVVDGKAVLPMVAGMSWMSNACAGLYPGFKVFGFDDYRVLKGVVFEDDLTDDFTLEIKELEKSADKIILEAMINSHPENSRMPRFHYKANIHLIDKILSRPVVAHMDLTPREDIDGESFYDDFTLFHNFSFKGVERLLNISREKVTLKCRLPIVPPAYQGQFPVQSFNYYMTDIGFQSMGIYAKHYYGAGSLPLKAGQGEHYLDVPWGEIFYITLDINSASETNLNTTLNIHDEHGNMYMRVSGGEITISSRLNDLFTRNKLPTKLG